MRGMVRGSSLHTTAVVRQKHSCSSPIEARYYSAKLGTLPGINAIGVGGAEKHSSLTKNIPSCSGNTQL